METYEQIRAERDTYRDSYAQLLRRMDGMIADSRIRRWHMRWDDFCYMLGRYLHATETMNRLHNSMTKFSFMWWILGGLMMREVYREDI